MLADINSTGKVAIMDKVFIDSNIWLYYFIKDDAKKYQIAEEYLLKSADSSIIISYQVVNEVTNQLLRNKFSETVIRENIEFLFKICAIHNDSKDVIFLASSLRTRYSFSYWDSLIVANALNSGSDALISEDMQDGLRIENMVIRNIFRP